MGTTPTQPASSDAGSSGSGRAPTQQITLRGAVFLGIGAMVGAGIFALLGQAGAIAGSAVWISFLAAGLVSLALGYAMAKMGTHYPSSGGLITYLIQGFGNGRLVGVAAWLGYLTAIVVVGAMVAVSFGEYGSAIVAGDNNATGGPSSSPPPWCWSRRSCASSDRARSTGHSRSSSIAPARRVRDLRAGHPHPPRHPPAGAERLPVDQVHRLERGADLLRLPRLRRDQLHRRRPRRTDQEHAARDVPRPGRHHGALRRHRPRRVRHAHGGPGRRSTARPRSQKRSDRPSATPDSPPWRSPHSSPPPRPSRRPCTPRRGSRARSPRSGQFPTAFGTTSRLGRHGGLWITTVATLLFVNVFDLGALASIGSAVSLAVFVLVGVAAIRLRQTIGAHLWIVLAGVLFSVVVLVVFAVDTYSNDPRRSGP